MKEIVIRKLQEKNEKLTNKCSRLESAVHAFGQYGRTKKDCFNRNY